MTDRDRLRALVEGLPEPEIHAALRFMEYLRLSEDDPVLAALQNAPPDDEPLTEEDVAALEEVYEDLAQGRVVSHEEARRRLLGEIELEGPLAGPSPQRGGTARPSHAAAHLRSRRSIEDDA